MPALVAVGGVAERAMFIKGVDTFSDVPCSGATLVKTPFDEHAGRANRAGYHNHRDNTHSDIISDGIVHDLAARCSPIRRDLETLAVGYWKNARIPWGRERNTDLVVSEALPQRGLGAAARPRSEGVGLQGAASIRGAEPNPKKIRIIVEHKSVLTAHRNKHARHDDLNNLWQQARRADSRVIVCATVMVGVSLRHLNVPDGVKKPYWKRVVGPRGREKRVFEQERFDREIVLRLREHDRRLFDEFSEYVSLNKPDDPAGTLKKLRSLPVRTLAAKGKIGFDAILIVPVHYDNVARARVERNNSLGIDIDADYDAFLSRIASRYAESWGK